jgi:hypothetical protein
VTAMGQVKIDTEGVRTLAQYTQGALEEVARIRTELLRAQGQLDHGPGADAFGKLLAALTDFGTVLADDRRNLVTEVLSIEAEDGVAPGAMTAQSPIPAKAAPGTVYVVVPMMSALVVREPTPPPEPWNTTWVTPSGVVPVGGATRPLSAGDNSIGDKWEAKSESDSDVGHNSSYASHEVRISGGANTSETTDSSGNTTYNWDTYQEMILKAQAGTSGNVGPVNYDLHGAAEAGARADQHLWVRGGPDGFGVGGEANAVAYADANASAGVGADGVGSANAKAGATAGAEAHAHGHGEVGPTGVKGGVGATAFSGADATVGLNGELGPLRGGREISVGTGIGVGLSGDFSLDWDDIGFDLGGKLGLGLALGIDTNFHFSPSGFVDGLGSIFDGENPLDAAGAEWDKQANDAAQQQADQASERGDDAGIHEVASAGDAPPDIKARHLS